MRNKELLDFERIPLIGSNVCRVTLFLEVIYRIQLIARMHDLTIGRLQLRLYLLLHGLFFLYDFLVLYMYFISSVSRILCVFALLLSFSIGLEAALVGHWKFDETSGTNLADSSGNGNCGTLCGPTVGACGKISNAVDFTAINQSVNVADSCSLSITGDITISAWINLDDTASFRSIVSKSNGNLPAPYDFYVNNPSNTLVFFRGNGAGALGLIVGCTDLDTAHLGTWVHVVATMSGTAANIYLDGSCDGSGTISTTIADNGKCLKIGNRDDGVTDMLGSMDDVAIWNEGMTADEIKGLYDLGNNACLGYHAGNFDSLKSVHDCGSGSVTICGTTWIYSSSLTCSAGLNVCGSNYTLVLDAASCTGLTTLSDLYWDDDGSTAGAASGTTAADTWSAAATKWSTSCAGTGCSINWVSGVNAYFAAGTDATGTYTVTVCGTQTVGGLFFEEGTVTLSGGTITMGDSTPCIDVAASRTATISSTVAGSNGITKTGAGTLNLTGTLSVAGDRNINGGTLNRTGTWVIENGETTTVRCGADMTVSSNLFIGDCSAGTMTITGSGSTLTACDRIYVGYQSSGSGTLNIQCGATVDQNVASEFLMVGCASTGVLNMTGCGTTLNVDGSLRIGKGACGDGTMTVQCGADINITCSSKFVLIGSSHASAVGRVTVTGSGSTITGGRMRVGHSSGGANILTVSNCAIVTADSDFSVATTSCTVGTVNVNSGGEIRMTALTIGGGSGSTGAVTLCGSGSKICASTSVTVGRSAGGSTASLTLNSGSCLTTPSLTIHNAASVTLNAADRIHDATDVTVNACGTFDLNNNNETIASLAGAGNVTLGSGTLTVGDCSSTTFSGVISETGSVTKVGTGTLTLSGANTNSGTYTVTAGQITIGANNVIDDNADINLNGGTLAISANFSDTADNFTVTENSVLALNTDTDLTFDDFALTATKTFNVTGFAKTTRYQTNQTGISLRFAEAGGWPSYDANNFFVNGTALSAGVYGFAHGGDGFIYLILLAPEPSTYVGIGGVCFFVVLHFVRRRRAKREKKASVI